MSKSKTDVADADQAQNESNNETAPRKAKVRVLAEAKRDGRTVKVLTDGIRVWKETGE